MELNNTLYYALYLFFSVSCFYNVLLSVGLLKDNWPLINVRWLTLTGFVFTFTQANAERFLETVFFGYGLFVYCCVQYYVGYSRRRSNNTN